MSGETEKDVSGWTTDTLHTHLRGMMGEMDRRVNDTIKALEAKVSHDAKCETVRVNERITLTEQKADVRFEAQKEAVTKAENATERRFESVNEFRSTLADQARELVSRNEFSTKVDGMGERIADLMQRMDRRDGSGTGRKDMWGWAIGGAGLILTLMSIVVMIMKFSGTSNDEPRKLQQQQRHEVRI